MHFLSSVLQIVRFFLQVSRQKVILIMAAGLVVVIIAPLVSIAHAESPGDVLDQFPPQGVTGGKAIFDRMCVGCHSIGGGKLVGPDLKDVTKRRDLQWIKSIILDPTKMLASDPTAQQLLKENNNMSMPNLGLTPDQVNQLVDFLSDPGAVSADPAPTGATGGGNKAVGERIFTGELALSNGGPHCLACHSVSGTGGLGGGGLGPDLTNVIRRYGESGLLATLKTIAFPTMLGPFQNQPLTAQEQADLVAFLKETDLWQAPPPVVAPGTLTLNAQLIFGIGLLGAGFLFVLLLFIWDGLKKNYFPRLPIRKV